MKGESFPKNNIQIGSRYIGREEAPYFIADIASNYDGELSRAYSLIRLARESGADAVKSQSFTAEKIVSQYGFNKLGNISHQASWKKSVYEVYRDASLPSHWIPYLKEYCDKIGIEYFTTPYDFETADRVEKYVNVYKIGSGDITWLDFIRHIAEKKKPVILSTGAAELDDVQRAWEALCGVPTILLQCNTNYTDNSSNSDYYNLRVISHYCQVYPQCVIGLSDHTRGNEMVLGALALGARVFEKHLTDDRNRIGPDHKFSTEPQEWADMVESANRLFRALGDGHKRVEENEKETVIVQRRCIRAKHDIRQGHIIESGDLDYLRPAPLGSLPPRMDRRVVGKQAKVFIEAGQHFTKDMIES